MRPFLLFAALSFATPGFADQPDQPDYNPDLLEECLSAKAGVVDRTACIGVAADACMSDDKGQTTVGMVQCLQLERGQWDGMLNDTYGQLMTEQKARDADLVALGSAVPAARVAKLETMEKHWIAYRDAACAFDAAQWDGGSGAGPSAETCMLDLTGRQALFLEEYLQDNRE